MSSPTGDPDRYPGSGSDAQRQPGSGSDVQRDPGSGSDSERGQVSGSAAEVYEEFFVPALFGEWTSRVAAAAGLGPGDRVLDVACGTGVLARHAAERVGADGEVVGLDPNAGMLAVAERLAPGLEWREGVAESLPFEDGAFDAVVSQFGLMFFDDRAAALGEMMRVLRPGGRLAVAVWASLDDTPGYRAMVALLRDEIGEAAAAALMAPFSLGEVEPLRSLLAESGLGAAEIATVEGEARFASLSEWVHTDVYGWTLAGMLDDGQYSRLKEAAAEKLAEFVGPDGRVRFPAPAHIITTTKPT